MLLDAAISNSDFNIPRGIRELLAGPLHPHKHIHDLCTYFRQRGVAHLLREADSEPYHVNTMQSAAAFAMELGRAPESEKVTSFARPLFDAVSSGYWDAATEIARRSRTTWNPDYEYEDDFLYVMAWLQLVLGATPAELEATLRRYERVLDGALDLRFTLLRTLVDRDAAAFDVALRALLEHRKAEADQLVERRAIKSETAAWVQNFALEGVALLKLAERLAIPTGKDYLHCPEIVRPDSPFVFDPNAWRAAAFSPMRRPTP
jgi:hypothetical protein